VTVDRRWEIDGIVARVVSGSRAEDLPEGLVDALEQLTFAAIGLTTVAIEQAAPGDLTLQQWRALVVIGRAGDVRVGDVAAQVGVSMPSASRLIARLMERGYVDSARDERDRRGTIVTLTSRGAEVRRTVIRRRRFLMRKALSADQTSLPSELGHGLATLARALERYA
jgi:DNA-binding MarR family transcriptional regulator